MTQKTTPRKGPGPKDAYRKFSRGSVPGVNRGQLAFTKTQQRKVRREMDAERLDHEPRATYRESMDECARRYG